MSAVTGSPPPADQGAKDSELEAAVKRFQELRTKEQQIIAKINEMVSQEAEYRLA